jgi:glycosyltransferase involved in cell wall biosynthesis
VLLEAGVRGMTVVATALEGIGELIDDETGWPAPAEAAGHAGALALALADPAEAARRASKLRRRILGRHSAASFDSALSAIPGYFGARR